jgi:mono/diheme cytochrome c family protein
MKNNVLTVVITAAAVAASVLGLGAAANQKPSTEKIVSTRSALVERGEYLVHRAGLCIDCHSPRDEKGEFIAAKHLTGSPLPFTPTVSMPWMPAAPRIAGLPAGFTEKDTAHFLMTGERPNGRPGALPPMPPYRFNRADAEAIAAYLRSLPGEAP